MGKKKGRQSGNFSSKSMKAAFHSELRDRMGEVSRRPVGFGGGQRVIQRHSSGPSPRTSSTISLSNRTTSCRPKLASLTQLRGILQERQVEDSQIFRAARRRLHHQRVAGTATTTSRNKRSSTTPTRKRPVPGYMISWGDKPTKKNENDDSRFKDVSSTSFVPTLQKLCMHALAPVLSEYIDAWGVQEVHAVLSLLPPHMLGELSVAVSSTTGITSDDMVVALGKHTNIQHLALHAPPSRDDKSNGIGHSNTSSKNQKQLHHLSDNGILQLIPKLALSLPDGQTGGLGENEQEDEDNSDIPESWEEQDGDDNVLEMEGCLRLQRLEMVNIQNISLDVTSKFFSRASGITHLSLSGSLSCQVGEDFFPLLPDWLPHLKVIDLSYCPWVSETLIEDFWNGYLDRVSNAHDGLGQNELSPLSPLPVIVVRECFSLSSAIIEDLMYEFGGKILTRLDQADSGLLDVDTAVSGFVPDVVPLQWSADPF